MVTSTYLAVLEYHSTSPISIFLTWACECDWFSSHTKKSNFIHLSILSAIVSIHTQYRKIIFHFTTAIKHWENILCSSFAVATCHKKSIRETLDRNRTLKPEQKKKNTSLETKIGEMKEKKKVAWKTFFAENEMIKCWTIWQTIRFPIKFIVDANFDATNE